MKSKVTGKCDFFFAWTAETARLFVIYFIFRIGPGVGVGAGAGVGADQEPEVGAGVGVGSAPPRPPGLSVIARVCLYFQLP